MMNGQKKVLTREQFLQLREARKLIKEEFSESIVLSEEDIVDTIYEYALKSEGEALFDLFNLINGSASSNTGRRLNSSVSKGKVESSKLPKIGDVIDGQTVTGIYRGKPVYK